MTNINDTLQIDTPENVTFDYDVAGIGSRFLAALVDTLLLLLAEVILIGSLIWLASALDSILFSKDVPVWWFLAIFGLVAFGFFWGYYIFFEIMWNGQTPGKRWVGIRVIRQDGTPVSAAEVVIRNLVRLIDFLPAAYGVGVVSMFVNQNSRRLGDLAAGTVVVHDRKVGAARELSAIGNRGALATVFTDVVVPADFPLERVTDQDLQIIEEFLIRRAQLANRSQLAHYIWSSLCARLAEPEDKFPTTNPEGMLAAIYRAIKSHNV
jgi:uncharacterized RDD family membrane protein YckC